MYQPHLVVDPWMRTLEHRDGAPTRVLEPGRHRRRRRATYTQVDVREQLGHTGVQEVLTADGVSVKVTAVVRWRVGDPVLFTQVAHVPFETVYVAVQIALREALSALEVETLMCAARTEVGTTARDAAGRAGRPVGIEVVDVVVKDVVLPSDLRAAYAEVVTVRQRALAQLEAARAEAAALRSLANGARLLDDHPALARLRLVQALPPGSTLRLK